MLHDQEEVDHFRALLHWPGRANRLDSVETHLIAASGLARALWHAAQSGLAFNDERDAEAFRQLAGELADHVSAAQLAFHIGLKNMESGK